MTNFEANNSSSATRTAAPTSAWQWLTDRLPSEGLERLDEWMDAQLTDLESTLDHMASPRSKSALSSRKSNQSNR